MCKAVWSTQLRQDVPSFLRRASRAGRGGSQLLAIQVPLKAHGYYHDLDLRRGPPSLSRASGHTAAAGRRASSLAQAAGPGRAARCALLLLPAGRRDSDGRAGGMH